MKQKFKVWDKKNLRFDDSNYIYVDMDGDIYLIEERNFAMMSHMHREEVSDQYELIWFTGLTDKNGVEIYDGDAVKGAYRIDEDWIKIQKVTYLNGCFMFGNWNAHEYFNKHTHIEVIGSIYTHPHLLGSEKE